MISRIGFSKTNLMTGGNVTKTECKEKILKHVNIQLNKLNAEQLNKLVAKHTGKKKKKKTKK
ncbi:hypothetical protein S-MbCM100_115 [Synechococcus phage S-MbCM100]|jgi:hypothetical protein|uniref:Uncharacterized protein n=3 Tax=Acionnavirus monteraybay TaxID=2734078 RepID=A0A0E3ES07_9CAUD|nr:hypothetical protein S-MbCM100_115 [Synechococcus phage S-MbCM100]AIX15160.1 hypothetical protein Syn7803C47_111 [Synechococcus phage ACG-2014a]AHB80965.1 hypothetical protein S-MbCM100_115 [Synechococcus phage S-MbCM100]AIX17123.1 hypothetical protein Syn7803C60_107 [Synechococcus phage ACG-2014a]AIX23091.1 hypothetical protein Syn7803C99_108 [Synechococcus phage ACG-2014a]AIX28245.1 hypothetical protein Syn7803US1_109 [Synechococcus phage ACG-2014a]